MSSEDRLQALRDRADSTKQYLENKYSMMRRHREERMRRKLSLEEQMERLRLSAEEREGLREELKKKELQLMRDARQRTSPADFEPLVLVGRGAFGEVRLVRHRETGKVFAMKTMAKHAMVLKNQVAHVRAERDLLAAADSSWVVRLHYSFQDASNLYMAMEYCPCGDLMGLLMREDVFSEDATRFYAAEAVLAIQSVHDLGYIHRDLKPDNILIDWDGHIKLTDLGLCKKVDAGLTEQAFGADREDLEATAAASAAGKRGPREPPAHGGRATHRTRRLAYTTVGTPDYIAPEVLLHRGYGKSCDWWSLGVILYECLVGYTPFFADDPPSTCRNIMRWRETLVFPPDALARLSKHAVDFVRRLVCDPADRLGAGGVEEIKAHPWFRGLDWGAVRKQTPPFEFEAGQRMEELMRTLGPLPATDPRFKAALTKLTENFDDFPDAPWPMRATGASRMPSHRDPAFVGYTFKRVPINNAVRVSAGVGSPRAALHLTAARRPVTIGGTTVGPGFGTIDAFDPAKVQRSSNASPGKSSRSSSAKPSPSKGRGDGSGDDDDDDDDPIFI